jgi:hypothetical protein
MRVRLKSAVQSLLRAATIGDISVSHVENLTARLNVEAERSNRAADRLNALCQRPTQPA